MATSFGFLHTRQSFYNALQAELGTDDISALVSCYAELPGSDHEKKGAMDQAFRDLLRDVVFQEKGVDTYLSVVNMASLAVQKDVCQASTFFVLLSDLFDSVVLEQCDRAFKFLEGRVSLWKSETFYNSGKNYMLRMCNDLLRRMSRSQNTVFCGRIQLFLARLFPLYEKSGLNLMSQFNVENVTLFNTKAEDYDKIREETFISHKNMDIEEGEEDDTQNSIPIDYNLYRKFWSLQNFFRKPSQCYEKAAWKEFINFAEEVLGCFDSFKLDDTKLLKKKIVNPSTQEHTYFAKYLTSEKLLDLQLSDSNFRRFVLVQFLIIFQYLNGSVKFKTPTQVITDEQSTWLKQTSEKIYSILHATPPDGEEFAKSIEHVLSREENWNSWKNDSCHNFVRTLTDEDAAVKMPKRALKRSMGDDLKASGGKLIKMGDSELTRLWNICPDNVEACKINTRLMPNVNEFMEAAIEQTDPDAQIEDQYKLVNNPNYAWKALRLMACSSPHFFAVQGSVQQKTFSLPQYLEQQMAKIAKDIQTNSQTTADADAKAEVMEGQEEEDGVGEEEEMPTDLDKQEETQPQPKDEGSLVPTSDQLSNLAKKLEIEWKKLATELSFPEDDITYFEGETTDIVAQGLKMLTIFTESDPERATVDCLRVALREVGQSGVADDVFGPGDS